jgi:hypothetical protein
VGLAVAVLATVPYVGSLGGGFVYDDHVLIEQRAAVHSLRRLPELWQGEFWKGLSVVHFRYLRPLVSTSYALDWALWDGHPFGFHLTNLVLHGAVSFLLYACVRRWSGAPMGAAVAVLGWAWHPSKVEAVSWISGRTDLWCALGILLLCTGVKDRLSGHVARGHALEILGLSVGLASKEHAIVAPAFVVAEAFVHFAKTGGGGLLLALRRALPHTAVVLAYLVLRAILLPIAPEQVATLPFLDARLFTVETLGEFGRVVAFPLPHSLFRAPIRVDEASRAIHDPSRIIGGIATVAILVGGAIILARRRDQRWRAVGFCLGAAALVPVANVLSPKMVFLFAERFAYLPLLGFALSVVPSTPLRAKGAVGWGLALAAMGLGSARHTRDFADDRHLWEHELTVDPEQPFALRWACEDAMQKHQNREALELAVRGYRASFGWPIPQPERVEFAVRAARSLEIITLDRERSTLEQIDAFYDTFLSGRGLARIEHPPISLSIDANGPEANNFRKGDKTRLAITYLWAAIAASRVEHCERAVRFTESYLEGNEQFGRVSAAVVLGRCGRIAAATQLLQPLDPQDRAVAELLANLDWIERASRFDAGTDVDQAMRQSRARTLLLDRGGAYRALLARKDEIVADPQGALFFARTAWAAGEDEAALKALSARLGADERAELLAAWSRELGRGP